MSEPDNFLSRWSRRKRAVAEDEENVARDTLVATETPAAGDKGSHDHVPAPARQAPGPAPVETEFDLASLPPIESIGAGTDVSAFLKPGVPTALRHAALRRVWITDPAIRDFRAPQEMDWNFNSPGLPGFGEIGPDVDIEKMAARIFGDVSPNESEMPLPETGQTVSAAKEIASAGQLYAASDLNAATDDHASAASVKTSLLRRKEYNALQQKESDEAAPVRRHGSALPK